MKSKKPLAPAFIVEKSKDNSHIMFTGTVLIPGEPDCDYENGEEILTEEKVAKMAHSYMDYRIVDKEHQYFQTGEEIGTPVESYLLPAPMKMRSIDGQEREYPKGTWVAKSMITDPEMIAKVERGEVAYSVTALPQEIAEKIAAKSRVLIKDLGENPVGFTLTLTEHPCVNNSCKASKKSNAALKVGRSISKQNETLLEKAVNTINEGVSQINSLLTQIRESGSDNMTERKKFEKSEEETEFVTKSDLEKFGDELVQKFKEATKEPPKPIKCNEISAGKSAKKKKSEKSEDEENGKGSSKSLPTHDDGKNPAAFKSMEYYMGRTAKGRPLKNKKE